MFDTIGEALQGFVLSIGYLGLFLLMVAESTFVPVPSVLIMPFAGSLAAGADPRFSLPLVILMNSLGALVGSAAFYEFGARGGKPILLRFGKWFLVKAADIERTEAYFHKPGRLTVFIARFIPVVRHFISFVAGLVSVAWVQRINLLSAPILAFFGGFAALMAGLYGWLHQLPPAQMSQTISLLGSGVIFSVIVLFVAAGAVRRINVYEAFVEGAKEGFGVAVQIIPYLIAILVAISVFRTTGGMDALMGAIAAAVKALGLDTDFVPALPVGLMKTLSGSGARGLMLDAMHTHGADSFVGRLACVFQGATDTTFYILAVYFGAVGVRNTRHAVACGLTADAAAIVAGILIGYVFFG